MKKFYSSKSAAQKYATKVKGTVKASTVNGVKGYVVEWTYKK